MFSFHRPIFCKNPLNSKVQTMIGILVRHYLDLHIRSTFLRSRSLQGL